MNTKKILSLFLSAVLTLAFLSGCTKAEKTSSDNLNVAIITKGSDSDFWSDLKDGALSAATEFNVKITFEGPDNESDCETQNKMIESAAARNVDAIVLSAIDYDKNAEAVEKAAQKGIKIITVDSDVDVNEKELFIGTDNLSAGEKTAEVVKKLCPDSGTVNIGIVNSGKNTENSNLRLKGFMTGISNIKNAKIVGTVNVASNTESATDGAKRLLSENPEINVLIGFNEWSALGVGNAIKELGVKDKVVGIGFDNNTKCVSMLESGELDTLIVQNPFSMGYLAVSNAARILSGKKTESVIKTDVYIVNRENMFTPDVQKILFSFDNYD